jgi:hypothetical protein
VEGGALISTSVTCSTDCATGSLLCTVRAQRDSGNCDQRVVRGSRQETERRDNFLTLQFTTDIFLQITQYKIQLHAV